MEQRNVLITNGMSSDMILIRTDAPKEAIERWCKSYSQELENGENTYLSSLQKNYYVEVLHDSELELNNDKVEAIGYEEVFDLNNY